MSHYVAHILPLDAATTELADFFAGLMIDQ